MNELSHHTEKYPIHYAQPRMTRDMDLVIAHLLQDLDTQPRIFGDEFYFSPEAAREAMGLGSGLSRRGD
jgi:hypothetical protein